MPRYYCDYCGLYIKNDSTRSRKEHIKGGKHRAAVIEYYTKVFDRYKTMFEEQHMGIKTQ